MLIRMARRPPGPDCCAIAVMAKASIPGRTKTRLVPPLTLEQAAALNSAFLDDVAENLALAAKHAPIASFMAFGPPGSAPFFEDRLSRDIGLLEIWSPDFGDCLFETVRQLLDLGYGAACVLNSDSPTLPTNRLIEVSRALMPSGDRAVLGPSTDGGYYLLGLKRPHRRLFQDVRWSTGVVAAQTRERAAEIALELVDLESWFDVDDIATLNRVATSLDDEGRVGYAAPHTAAALRSLLPQSDIRKAWP